MEAVYGSIRMTVYGSTVVYGYGYGSTVECGWQYTAVFGSRSGGVEAVCGAPRTPILNSSTLSSTLDFRTLVPYPSGIEFHFMIPELKILNVKPYTLST